MTDSQVSDRAERLVRQFDAALARLDEAPAFAKVRHQEDAFALASDLMDSDAGFDALLERADRFDGAGLFHGGPWEDPSRLIPALVGGSLKGEGVYPTVETLSMLRLLALADGRARSDGFDAADAHEFLGAAAVLNLEFLSPAPTEDLRKRPKIYRRAQRLIERVLRIVPPGDLCEHVVEEIDLRATQRPILTASIEELVARACELQQLGGGASAAGATLDEFERSLGAATERSRRAGDPLAYRRELLELACDDLVAESREFAALLRKTGLASPYHAVVLRRIAAREPARLGAALCANDTGVAQAERCAELLQRLVNQAIVPDTRFAILGLVRALERSLLSRNEVAGGLRKIADIAIRPEIALALLEPFDEASGLGSNAALLAGCLAVLGLPLGIGQGNNPTCQSARAISLWSLHAPGFLLSKLASVARDGFYEAQFEGQVIRSDALAPGVATEGVGNDLDPVSVVLVPHLDRVYGHMMSLVSARGEDGHRWVNPSFYGHWVKSGFASAFELGSGQVLRYESFVRRFYATHHPQHNDGHELLYPNPVGIMLTDVHGRLLGRHAVSIQRVAADPDGTDDHGDAQRVYFFNPNNEGRQDWGGDVRPTVAGHGERSGESSLPFADFASRLYAFHYDPQEEGDAFAVPADVVARVQQAARSTWIATLAPGL